MNKVEINLKEAFIKAINVIDETVEVTVEQIVIEIPKDTKNGDYATNAAMRLAKVLKDSPINIANKIKENFDMEYANVEAIDIAGPGFINITMNKASIANTLKSIILQGSEYGQWPEISNDLINVEYVSANPTGDLHLGHARQASLGDSISRIYKKAGYNVVREYYINDAGNQINNLAKSVIVRYHELFDIEMPMPEDGYFGQDIKNVAELIKNLKGDQFINDDSEETFQYIKKTALTYELDKIKRDLQEFRVEFDIWTSEQKLYDSGRVEKALELLESKNATYEKDGALWLETTRLGDDKDRVLKKSDGSYTYLTPDIANHIQKLDAGSDYMVDLWGADHHGYIKRMKAAIEFCTGQSDKFDVDIVQLVRLIEDGKEVKMSKRSGNAIGMIELSQEVGIDAVRYFFAQRAGSSHFDFDLGLAKSKSNENPVFYVQYAHARICSILKASLELNLAKEANLALLDKEKEISIIKHLNEFPATIADSAKTRAPHKIVNYVSKLASLFHSYYNEYKVIDQEDLETTNARIVLLEATKITLANSLELIGVSAPEKM
ncbi:arginine--tRNA ligase [Mycoplasma sp. P36-A1]|uniref:arginine--tRNA ligase n=1 Tax=Mycoplasma sp. P36-A1 TaxID=3252900 RepID=UPI003C2F6502